MSPRRAIRRRLAWALDPDAQKRAYDAALMDVRVLALSIHNPCPSIQLRTWSWRDCLRPTERRGLRDQPTRRTKMADDDMDQARGNLENAVYRALEAGMTAAAILAEVEHVIGAAGEDE